MGNGWDRISAGTGKSGRGYRGWFWVLLLLFFYSCTPPGDRYGNVVVVVIDTLRADHLPMYGYPRNTSPFLQRLSEDSLVFEKTFSSSSWTAPATASILTSLYPAQHGVHMGFLAFQRAREIDPDILLHRLPGEVETLAEILKKAGFRTFGISDNLNISRQQGFSQGFDFFETHNDQGADHINQRILRWKQDILDGNRYFLYIHYNDPHAPYQHRQPWYRRQENRRENAIAAYDSEIRFTDHHFSKLYEALGLDQNTLLVVTADHGEGLWDHGLKGHGNSLFREEIHVPLLIRLPGGKSRKISHPVSTLDIVPTLHDALKLPLPENYSGISLLAGGRDRFKKERNRVLFSHLKIETKTSTADQLRTVEWRAAVRGNWHFIHQLPRNRFLYSLTEDPGEKDNILSEEPKISRELQNKIKTFHQRFRGYPSRRIRHQLDEEELEKLKSLGYIR